MERGVITIHRSKEGEPKLVPLLPEDVELARKMRDRYPGFPAQHFFRSHKGDHGGVKEGVPFNEKRLRRAWRKACDALGIEYVPPYPATKHSTVTALREEGLSPEEIKRATGHRSNMAFDRYFQTDDDARRLVFAKARRGGQGVVHLEASGAQVEPGFPVSPPRK